MQIGIRLPATTSQGVVKVNGSEQVRIFSTAPQSRDHSRENYFKTVVSAAQWSENYGCEGILVYTDNQILDPWLVSQVIIENSCRLSPLIALQPAYMHPYSAAKMVTSIAYLYRRRLYLNMVAGGFT